MRKILFILIALSFVSINADATGYYFSSKDGADGNTGLSPAQAWETGAKFRSILSTLNPGDTVYFHSSCTWDEFYAVLNNVDGAYDNEIVFTSYGNGRRPVFRGTKDYSGTLSAAANLYSISGDADIGDRVWPRVFSQIWIDSLYYEPSRYPNTGMLTASGGSTTSLTDADEAWNTNEFVDGVMTGYLVAWEWTQGLISSNTTSEMNFSNSLSYEDGSNPVTPGNGDYYFIQGSSSSRVTETDGENYFEDDGFTVYWSADNLNSGHVVECTVIDTMWHFLNCSYIKIENLICERVNQYTFVLEGSDNITITGNAFNMSNGGHVRGYQSDSISIINNYFHETQNTCIFTEYCGPVYVTSNDFKNITIREGQRNLNTRYNSCIGAGHSSDSVVVKYNDADTIASFWNGHINLYGVNLHKNTITHYGWTDLADNGAIYQGGEYGSAIKNYTYNILINSKDNSETYSYGTSSQEFFHAFYSDYNSHNIDFYRNTIYNSNMLAMVNGGDPNGGTGLIFDDNLSYNCAKDMAGQWATSYSFSESEVSGYPRNNEITTNTMIFGDNSSEVAYTFRDLDNTGNDFDLNYFVDPFEYASPSIYKRIDNYSVTDEYDIDQLCTFESLDCGSRYNYQAWNYSNVSGTYSSDEFMVPVWNGEDDNWYFDLGNCIVKDAKTGINYTDSVLISPHRGNVFMMVSGTRSTLGDTSNWTAPLTWNEIIGDTSHTEPVCDYYITITDTTVTNDSSLFLFENNLNAEFGSVTLSGTAFFGSSYNCEGSYGLSESTEIINSSSVNLKDSFSIAIQYATWTTTAGWVIAGNKSTASGSGWQIQRGSSGQLLFITENSSGTRDTSSSNTSAIGGGGICYDLQFKVSKEYGFCSILVDGVYVTSSDSTIRTDFLTDASFSIMADIDGNNRLYSYLDSLDIRWYGQTITSRDSCVIKVDGNPYDTLYCYEYDTASNIGAFVVESACGIDSTLVMFNDQSYIRFDNVDFDQGTINRLDIGAIDNTNSTLEVRIGNYNGRVIGEFSLSGATCQIEEIVISNITGKHNVYIVQSKDHTTPTNMPRFAWAVFEYETPPAAEDGYAKITGWRLTGGRKVLNW